MQILLLKFKNTLFFILTIISVLIFLENGLVGAAPNDTLQAILNGTPYYDYAGKDASSSSCGVNIVTIPNIPSDASSSGSWTAGPTTGPYYMEEFAINVLEDVAQKTNTPVSSVLTQEHVIALVGWFVREGGDIKDGPPSGNLESANLFNPLNTSITDSTIETTVAGGGLESFLSFNDGVEGTARTIVGSYQDRIAAVLTQPSSTAEQVANTIADFQYYPGNKAWASPGGQPTEAQVVSDNQLNYLPTLLSAIENVRTDYVQYATLEIGTPNAELLENLNVNSVLLQYHPETATSTNTNSSTSSSQSNTSNCSSSSTGAGIANFVYYSQCDNSWGTVSYGDAGDIICSSGCGPTSVAMVVATLAKSSVTPDQTAALSMSTGGWDPGVGTKWSFFASGTSHYGLKPTDLQTNIEEAVTLLQNGGLVIAAGTGAIPFTTAGHIIVLKGVSSNGDIIVADPDPQHTQTQYSINDIVSAGLQDLVGVTN
jgi:hypothetical protein